MHDTIQLIVWQLYTCWCPVVTTSWSVSILRTSPANHGAGGGGGGGCFEVVGR